MLVAGLNSGSASAHNSERVVLFDQSHGQRFLLESEEPLGLSGLAGALLAEGLTPKALTGGITPEALLGVGALVVSGPFQAFSKSESEAVIAFLNNGGRLCIMLHISYPVMPLLKQLGVAVTKAPVRDQINLIAGRQLDFKVTTFENHPLTAGIDGFGVYGCWGLINLDDNSKVLAATSPKGWSDMNGDDVRGEAEREMALGVLVAGRIGKGEFVVVGDDAVFQNKFLSGGNLVLADNLSAWLKVGTGNGL
jgi:hypothetical protein